MKKLRILINEDSPADAILLEQVIGKTFPDFDSQCVETEEDFLRELQEFDPDIIISDYYLPTFDGMRALELAKDRAPFIPFIISTGSMNELTAVECMKAGADDYVLKDQLGRMGSAIQSAIEKKTIVQEKNLAEQQLARSESKFRAIFEHVNDAILLMQDSIIVDCNPMAEHLFGTPRDYILYQSLADFSPRLQRNGEESRQGSEEKILKALQGIPQFFEWQHRKANGTEFDVDIKLSATRIDDKPVVLAVLRDITEKKRTERELRDSTEKYQLLSQEFTTLLDTIPDFIMLHNPDMKVVWANQAVTEKIGAERGGFATEDCFQMIHGISSPQHNCPVLQAITTGMPAKQIVDVIGGSTLEVRAMPLMNQQGELVSVLEVCRDVSEMKSLQKQLIHAQKMEAVGQLAGGIAHDFNNIVTALIGYGSLIRIKMSEDDPLLHYVDQMLTTAERAAELTHGLLDFSRKKETNLVLSNVNDVVRSSENFLAKVIGEEVIFDISLDPEPLYALVDRSQLEQVLTNLATNARDAMPGGGTITISSDQCEVDEDFVAGHGYGEPGYFVRLTISDTGTGMDEPTMSRIFQPFFTTKEEGRGTGLGLSIVYRIIKDHNGYINVYSEKGRGTTFKIYLPLIGMETTAHRVTEDTNPDGGSETILVAEDDDFVRETIVGLLTDFGYRVVEAVDGEQAIAAFESARDDFQLLILDVLMPKKGGREVSAAARVLRPDIRVLFCSGYPYDLLQNKGLLQQGENFYLKPISPRELLRKVREVLNLPRVV